MLLGCFPLSASVRSTDPVTFPTQIAGTDVDYSTSSGARCFAQGLLALHAKQPSLRQAGWAVVDLTRQCQARRLHTQAIKAHVAVPDPHTQWEQVAAGELKDCDDLPQPTARGQQKMRLGFEDLASVHVPELRMAGSSFTFWAQSAPV
eukprot:1707567-Amphidinium_carterae.1